MTAPGRGRLGEGQRVEPPPFDRVVRTLAAGGSRRALSARLAGAAFGGILATAGLASVGSDPKGPKRPKGPKGGDQGNGRGSGTEHADVAPSAGPIDSAAPSPTGTTNDRDCAGPCAQPQPSSALQATMRAGQCDQVGPAAAALQAPTIPTGPVQGAPGAIAGATSFTPASLSLATLLATPHVVTIARADTLVACGAVGGVIAADGSLTTVLRPHGGSGVIGLAFIAASGSISLFIDPGPSEAATPAPVPSGVTRLPTMAPTPVG